MIRLLLILLPLFVFAQDYPSTPVDFAEIMDNMVVEDGVPYEELYENLWQAFSHRIDLNKVTREQLLHLHLLSSRQVEAILNYRQQAGKIYSVYELQVIPEMDHPSFSRIAPFLTVSDKTGKPFLKRLLGEENKLFIMRWDRTLEKQAGYGDIKTPYEGSPDRMYWRLRTSRPGDFSLGITGEKDPGEKLKWDGKTKGMDFLSAHFQIQNRGRLKNLILGDFGAQFGQGLALGTAFGIGKNAEAVSTMRRSNIGFLPFTSRYETGFFRGLAASYRVAKNITFHTLLSRLKKDASGDSAFVSSLLGSGFHRTEKEIARQKTLAETNAAGVLQWEKGNLDAGLIFHTTRFGLPIYPNQKLYNQFSFSGNENTNAGAYLNYTFSAASLFGEFTQTLRHGRGWVAGTLVNLTPALDMALHVRSFSRNFYTLYSNAIAENTTPQNETAVYWGWKYQPGKKYSFSAYFDMFQFEWLKPFVYAPSHGYEWLMRFNYIPAKTTTFSLQVRQQSKPRNEREAGNKVTPALLTHYILNAEYAPARSLKLRTRVQWTAFHQTTASNGMLLLQDVAWRSRKFEFSGRVALFDTDGRQVRIYAYEPDLPMSFSWPAFQGSGFRQVLMIEYKYTKKNSFCIRWSRTKYSDRKQIGSQGERISGPVKTDIKIQSIIRF